MEVLDLWKVVEEDYEILLLPNNPSMTQIKHHKDKKTQKRKVRSCLFDGVSTTMFTSLLRSF